VVARDPASVRGDQHPLDLLYVEAITLARNRSAQSMAVTLVLLIAAAAAYAVVLRPLDELMISAGGLILAVWGIR